MTLTYIDAGVLIAAVRGTIPIAKKALNILDDPNREFASSVFVRLEVLPKAIYQKRLAEIEFYETFFGAVTRWADSLESVLENAYHKACDSGLAALDAIHVGAATSVGAQEMVTTEKPGKPLCQVKSIQVVSMWFEDAK